jgi:uncharacterized protein YdaU (DUF1376 family)
MHYYQHHIGDFIKATSCLTDSQAMAYLRLIWMYYDSEKPLPNNIDVLALQVGLPQEEVQLLLKAYFRLDDGFWKHTRCDAELEEYRSFIDKKSRAGKASAKQRKNSSTTSDEQVFNECSTDVQLTTNHKPITNKNTNTTLQRPDDVSETVWEDWVKHRKNLKAIVTETVIKKIRSESSKAGIPFQSALELMCARGWRGFDSEWLKKPTANNENTMMRRVL